MFCLEELTSSLNTTSASEDRTMQVLHLLGNHNPKLKPSQQFMYMHICFRICNLPHFYGFRMKTWSWLKWSYWDSLWRGIWPWLSSKRARWKPEYQHFLLYIKLKRYKPCFNNKTLNQTCSERIYFCSCSNHITSSSMYMTLKIKTSHSCHGTNSKYICNMYITQTLSEDWYKNTLTPTMTCLFTWFSSFYQFSQLTISRFSKTITLDSWTKYTDQQKEL